jgi:hypothetical protein
MIVFCGPTTRSFARSEENDLVCTLLLIRIDSWKATSVPFTESRHGRTSFVNREWTQAKTAARQ